MKDRRHRRLARGAQVLAWAAVIPMPFLTHLALTTGQSIGAVGLAVLQAGILAVVAWRREPAWQRWLGGMAALGLLLLAARWTGGLALIVSAGASHAIIYCSLLVLFVQSLRPGRTALVTILAIRVRGALTPAERAYTRIVTKAWCVFFVGQVCASALLLAFAPTRAWSLFVNVLDAPLVVALFLAESAVRRWRFRGQRHASPLAVARAFMRDRAGG